MALFLEADSINAWLSDTHFAVDYVEKPCEAVLDAKAA